MAFSSRASSSSTTTTSVLTTPTNPMHQRRNNGSSSHSTTSNSTNPMYNNPSNGSASRRYDIEGGTGGGGLGSRSAPAGRSRDDTNSNILEQQNNERISMLSDQVSRLKGLTIDIGNEVREQNSLLDGMGDGFQNTRDLLSGSLRRIGTMLQAGGMTHMCYMVAFCVFVMVFLWFLMSHKGKSGA